MGCVGFGFGFGVKLAQCRIMLITGDQQFNPWWYLRHYDESSECAHVSINVRGSLLLIPRGSLLPIQEDTDGVHQPPF